MADIREGDLLTCSSPVKRARATSSMVMEDKIAAEKCGQKIAEEMESSASAQDIPSWVVKLESVRSSERIDVCQRNNGDLYFRDSFGCSSDLPSKAGEFFTPGDTVKNLCKKARTYYGENYEICVHQPSQTDG